MAEQMCSYISIHRDLTLWLYSNLVFTNWLYLNIICPLQQLKGVILTFFLFQWLDH